MEDFLHQILAQCDPVLQNSGGLYVSLFFAGLIGGATHCAPMCGAFVLAQSGKLEKLTQVALLPYHLGRMTTYLFMAALFASVLNLAFLYMPIREFVIAPVLALAGLIFIVSAFPKLSMVFPWLVRARLILPYNLISRGFQKMAQDTGLVKQYLMGVLLGFMPCGLIVGALMASATAPSVLESVAAMGAFGVGTMPALLAVAFGGKQVVSKSPRFAGAISQTAMIWSGLFLIGTAGFLLI